MGLAVFTQYLVTGHAPGISSSVDFYQQHGQVSERPPAPGHRQDSRVPHTQGRHPMKVVNLRDPPHTCSSHRPRMGLAIC